MRFRPSVRSLSLFLLAAWCMHAQQAPSPTAAKPTVQDLPKAAELDILRAYSTYAPTESQANAAQAELLAAQVRFEQAKARYTAARETYTRKSAEIARANGCAEIDGSGDHPRCVLADSKPKEATRP